jgi:hypothetical protein
MKIWKQWIIVAIIAIFCIVGFIGCPPDDTKPTLKCECNEKEHDGACGTSCSGKGVSPCNCFDVVREYNDLTLLGRNIKLVDETENAESLEKRNIKQKIQDGLTALAVAPGSTFTNKFDLIYSGFKIRIVKDDTYLDFVLGYAIGGYEIFFRETDVKGYNTNTIRNHISDAVIYDIIVTNAPSMDNFKNTIRMVKIPVSSNVWLLTTVSVNIILWNNGIRTTVA